MTSSYSSSGGVVCPGGAGLRECIRKTSRIVMALSGESEVKVLEERMWHDEVQLKVEEENGKKGWMSKNDVRQLPKSVIRGAGNAGKRVIGLSADGRIVREDEASSVSRAIQCSTRTEAKSTVVKTESPSLIKKKEVDLKGMLSEVDRECYGGEPREGGGPNPANEVYASLSQLLNRLKYHRGRGRAENIPVESELIELVRYSSKPALAVAARYLISIYIRRARRGYGLLDEPAVPVWATRGRPGTEVPSIRALNGAAGAAWRDPIDGGLDDWTEYEDVDALPPRKAEYSPSRRKARWAFIPDSPPSKIVATLHALVPPPSELVGKYIDIRGGAGLDHYGYAWGQSLSDLWISVPVSIEIAKKSYIQCSFQSKHLLLAFRLLLNDTKYCISSLIDAPLWAPIDASAATWHLETCHIDGTSSLSFSILILSMPKLEGAWWSSICTGHPRIRPRDFDFMVN